MGNGALRPFGVHQAKGTASYQLGALMERHGPCAWCATAWHFPFLSPGTYAKLPGSDLMRWGIGIGDNDPQDFATAARHR